MADEKQTDKAKPSEKFEIWRLRPQVDVSLANKKMVEWPSNRHPGSSVSETRDHFVIATADGNAYTKVPLQHAVVEYRRVQTKTK